MPWMNWHGLAQALTFERVMLALVHWRKADMVPLIVRWQRSDRVEEVPPPKRERERVIVLLPRVE